MLCTWVISTRGCWLQAAFARCMRLKFDTLNPTRKYLNMRNGVLLHEYDLQHLLCIQVGKDQL